MLILVEGYHRGGRELVKIIYITPKTYLSHTPSDSLEQRNLESSL